MTPEALRQAMEATWPPASRHEIGPVTLREGQGGGKRVSAATVAPGWSPAELDRACQAMRAAGQAPLFMVTPDQTDLDAELVRRGFALVDPVLGYAAPIAALDRPTPWLTAFPHWPPMEIAWQIWAENHIGPARQAVMERVTGERAVILARTKDRPSGLAFVAMSNGIAMLHALAIRPAYRRLGTAGHLVQAAASWAAEHDATELGLVVTEANAPARALYAKLGMQPVEGYHYREARQDPSAA